MGVFCRKLCAFALLIASSTMAVAAAPQTRDSLLVDCTMTPSKKGGDWIAPRYLFTVHRNGNVFVVDQVGLYMSDHSLPAKIYRKGDKLRLEWSIGLKREQFEHSARLEEEVIDLHYLAKLNIKSGKITVKAGTKKSRPTRYQSAGSCVFQSPQG